jgi:Na+-driven multidrug efflux pump
MIKKIIAVCILTILVLLFIWSVILSEGSVGAGLAVIGGAVLATALLVWALYQLVD